MVAEITRRPRQGAIGADLLKLARLEEPQEQLLHPERHFADFIEKDGPRVGELQLPRLVPICAGEAAFHVPEQLRFQKCLGDPGAIDRHKRPVRAVALGVNRSSDNLFTGAAFARNQDFGVRSSDTIDFLFQIDNDLAITDQIYDVTFHGDSPSTH